MMPLLTGSQLRCFREEGYAIVPRLVNEQLLLSYRQQFWSLPEINADPDDSSTWPEAPPCAFSFSPPLCTTHTSHQLIIEGSGWLTD